MLKEVSIGNLIEKAFERHASRECIGEVGRYRVFSSTYAQLNEKVKRCRRLLETLKEDDRVLILGANSTNWLVVFFACIQSGIVIVPLDTQSSPELVRRIQSEVKAKLFFNDRGLKVPGAKSINLAMLDLLLDKPTEKPLVKRVPGDLLEIVYTSGTTGVPKGVMLTHKNIIANIEELTNLVRLPAGLRLASVLPMSHMLQQVVGVLYPFVLGEKVFLPKTVHASRLAELIKTRKIHALVCVPAVMESLRNHIERSHSSVMRELGIQFRLIGVGGAATPIEMQRWWNKRMVQVLEGYGLTEAGPLVALNTFRQKRLGTVGKPLPGLQVKIGNRNEVLVKGDNVMRGYYKKPKETAATIKDGWLYTGDEGEFLDGFLVIKGRIKDAIKTSSGLMIWPSDIEAVLNRTQGVIESCVLEKDNKVHAVLILDDPKKAKTVITQANKKLQTNQKITSWSLWHEGAFPKTPTGKIRKFIVMQKLRARPVAVFRHKDPVVDVVQRVLNTTLRPNDKLAIKGMDSLARVEIVAALEQELGLELEETELDDTTTVADLQKLSKKALAAGLPRWQLSWWSCALRAIGQPFIRAGMRIWAKTTPKESQRVSGTGPFIFVINHTSAWDAAIVIDCLPKQMRKVAIPALPFLFGIPPAKKRILQAWRRVQGWFISQFFNAYPFGPDIGVERSLRFTGELLDRGYSILIFPEGQRTEDGKVHSFQEGIGVLAQEMRVPIVPVRIKGLFEILPKGRRWPKSGTCTVTFGHPITSFARMSPAEIAEQLEETIKKL